MAAKLQISFSKEYVMEVAIAELRKRHNIPDEYATSVRDYGASDFLKFSEVKPKETEESEEA